MSSKPITPNSVTSVKAAALPDAVIDVFNELITRNWDGSKAVVKQDDAVTLIAKCLKIRRQTAFDRGYLDVENTFRAVGWFVFYDAPGYNEDYPAIFTFSK